MKKVFRMAGLFLASACMLGSCADKGSNCCSNVKVESNIDSVAYALGLNQGSIMAKNLKDMPGDSLPMSVFVKGLVSALKADSANITMDDQEINELLSAYFTKLREAEMDRMEKEAIKNKLTSDSALTANKAKEGVQVTASGLQYRVITEGTGVKPKETDTVFVHYVGKLVDGTVFDASANHSPEPAKFAANLVIPGWTEGLQLMKKGAKYEFLIPAELAYGERGNAGIAPNSALWFEVELLDVRPAKK